MEIKLNKKDNIKNISSQECFEKLSIEVHSQLIDVRTKPEWIYVGVPDLSSINKKVIFVSWQVYPEMGTNKFFENQILESNIKLLDPIKFTFSPVLELNCLNSLSRIFTSISTGLFFSSFTFFISDSKIYTPLRNLSTSLIIFFGLKRFVS